MIGTACLSNYHCLGIPQAGRGMTVILYQGTGTDTGLRLGYLRLSSLARG